MGYTHYWKRNKKFNENNFEKVVKDFLKVIPVIEMLGVELAGWDGKSNAEINNREISFNGWENCGHEERNLGITWPAKKASGITLAYKKVKTENRNTLLTTLCGEQQELAINDSDINGQWYAGLNLNQRTCGGDCSHESFVLPLKITPEKWQKPEKGKFFVFCKTAYKPYDLAVNICLIIAEHYLKNEIIVSSDGNIEHWNDGIIICHKLLGYGKDFQLSD